MKKKGKIILVIMISLLIPILSYGISFLIDNYRILKSGLSNQVKEIEIKSLETENFKINNNELISDDDTSSFDIEFDTPVYINKLLFDINNTSNVDWTINIKYLNSYGAEELDEIKGTANSSINIFSEKIGLTIKELMITFDGNIALSNIRINNSINYFPNYFIFFCVLGFTILVLICFRKKLSEKIEYVFLIIALGCGTMMLYYYPIEMGLSWDDHIHYYLTYGLFHKNYTDASYDLIDSVGNDYLDFNTHEEENAHTEYLNELNSSVSSIKCKSEFTYSKISYIIPGTVMKVCEILHIPFSLTLKLGKLSILLIYILLVFLAIKITPVGKYLMLVIGLLPINLFMATNFSYDSPITALILLGFACFFHEYYGDEEKINPKYIATSIIAFSMASFIKMVYFPLITVLLLLPKNKFKNKKRRIIFIISILALCILFILPNFIPLASNTAVGDVRGGNVNVSEQLSLITSSPVSFTKIFYDNAVKNLFYKFFDERTLTYPPFFGYSSQSNSYYLLLLVLLSAIFMDNKAAQKKGIKIKVMIVFDIILIICMIWGALYLTYTPVGSMTISGVQNRYFVPLLFPLLFLLYNNKIKIEISNLTKYYIYCICLLFIEFTLAFEYIVPLIS